MTILTQSHPALIYSVSRSSLISPGLIYRIRTEFLSGSLLVPSSSRKVKDCKTLHKDIANIVGLVQRALDRQVKMAHLSQPSVVLDAALPLGVRGSRKAQASCRFVYCNSWIQEKITCFSIISTVDHYLNKLKNMFVNFNVMLWVNDFEGSAFYLLVPSYKLFLY